jgi:hypothetical protein
MCHLVFIFVILALLSGCGGSAAKVVVDNPIPPTEGVVLVPEAGSLSESAGGAVVDYSNAADGYVMASYSGDKDKVKLMIEKGDTTYKFDLDPSGEQEVFPLTMGDGAYKVGVYENVSGTQYAMALNVPVDVTLADPLLPFLYPSQYVDFNAGSAAVAKGKELAAGAESHLEVVSNIFTYVIENVTYDVEKADTIQRENVTGYLPDIDETLASGKGICFDYASLMAAMLRSQNIPTRLEVGYVSGGVYHAWISVHTPETGWIDNIIQFDGVNWSMMDPTFASSAGANQELVGDGTNYSMMYQY